MKALYFDLRFVLFYSTLFFVICSCEQNIKNSQLSDFKLTLEEVNNYDKISSINNGLYYEKIWVTSEKWKCFERDSIQLGFIKKAENTVKALRTFNDSFLLLLTNSGNTQKLNSSLKSFKLAYSDIVKDDFITEILKVKLKSINTKESIDSEDFTQYKNFMNESLIFEFKILLLIEKKLDEMYHERKKYWNYEVLDDKFDCSSPELPNGFILTQPRQ